MPLKAIALIHSLDEEHIVIILLEFTKIRDPALETSSGRTLNTGMCKVDRGLIYPQRTSCISLSNGLPGEKPVIELVFYRGSGVLPTVFTQIDKYLVRNKRKQRAVIPDQTQTRHAAQE
ncbi:hypothetical protein RF11_12523 [Thelohanellus kitauei]|uniref:Uncharacterized protein n=1 Tax=Thelohanellus kitauei TaxID=669202 RepID=A0A0C2J420_THEKT|nr:hypothetical protein RF11_12523 [Thelohanellus kitauei]